MLESIFGIKDHLSVGQECARAVLIFAYGLTMLRLSGRRTFAQFSAIDMIISIIIGSSLSRALTGSAPLIGTLAAVAVLVVLHLLAAYGAARSIRVAALLEGEPVELGRDGALLEKQRLACKISFADLSESLRQKGLDGLSDLDKTQMLVLEPSGKISIVKKQP